MYAHKGKKPKGGTKTEATRGDKQKHRLTGMHQSPLNHAETE